VLRPLILCWVAMFAACSDGSGPGFGTCPQTGEFANFGCAKVEGVVRDQAGTPLANAWVTLTPADEVTNTFDSPTHTTDATGAYSLEIHDYGFGSRHAPPADPVPMNLRASLLPDSPEDVMPTSVVPVSLKFVPVGELPEILAIDITIDVSP
jgi:hypothetical protein